LEHRTFIRVEEADEVVEVEEEGDTVPHNTTRSSEDQCIQHCNNDTQEEHLEVTSVVRMVCEEI